LNTFWKSQALLCCSEATAKTLLCKVNSSSSIS
jgi:hypothetical protein